MAFLNEQDFKKQISSGELPPLCLVFGDEDYLKKHYVSLLEKKSVDEAMAQFNLHRINGDGSNMVWLLVDGLEAGNANARNASFAFDNMGAGALVCSNLLTAWIENPENDPIEEVVAAAQRMKRNITTYVTVL